MSSSGVAYNTYEAIVSGIVGAVHLYFKRNRATSKDLIEAGLEKAIINVVASLAPPYALSRKADQIDVEYLVSAVLAGLYHSRNSMEAAGDQMLISIISHLVSHMSAKSGTTWFQQNVYGTTAATGGGSVGG